MSLRVFTYKAQTLQVGTAQDALVQLSAQLAVERLEGRTIVFTNSVFDILQEHVEIFQQGVEAWNGWRREHRAIQTDLSGIKLANAHLEESRQILNIIVKEVLSRERLAKERETVSPRLFPLYLDKDPQEMRGMWWKLLQLAKRSWSNFADWRDHTAYQGALKQLLDDLSLYDEYLNRS